MATSIMTNARRIEGLGAKIISCNSETCEGIERNQAEGYYPRGFFLYPNDESPLDIAVVGANPGRAPIEELAWYSDIYKKERDELETYRDLREIWRRFPRAEKGPYWRPYYEKLKGFLRALESEGLINFQGILFSEVVFCQTEHGCSGVPKDTLCSCAQRFFRRKEMIELLSTCRHVICLGIGGAFDYLRTIPESRQWKIIGLYNPSPARARQPYTFANYFEKEKLRKTIIKDLRAWEKLQKPYEVKVTPFGTRPSLIKQEVADRALTSRS